VSKTKKKSHRARLEAIRIYDRGKSDEQPEKDPPDKAPDNPPKKRQPMKSDKRISNKAPDKLPEKPPGKPQPMKPDTRMSIMT